MALGLTQAVTEVSTRNIYWVVKEAVLRADNLTTFIPLLLPFIYIVEDLDAGLLCFLDAGRLARNQQPEGPATGHLDTGFSLFSLVLEQMLGWFPLFPSCHYMLPM